MNIQEFEKLSNYQKTEVLYWSNTFRVAKNALIIAGVLVVISIAGCPPYGVWKEGLSGQAELARAEQNRKIAINEAKAIKESSVFKADAEVIRAKGVYSANEIIAGGLGGPQGYLRYLYISSIADSSCDIRYIPTEAGLPILEARNPK